MFDEYYVHGMLRDLDSPEACDELSQVDVLEFSIVFEGSPSEFRQAFLGHPLCRVGEVCDPYPPPPEGAPLVLSFEGDWLVLESWRWAWTPNPPSMRLQTKPDDSGLGTWVVVQFVPCQVVPTLRVRWLQMCGWATVWMLSSAVAGALTHSYWPVALMATWLGLRFASGMARRRARDLPWHEGNVGRREEDDDFGRLWISLFHRNTWAHGRDHGAVVVLLVRVLADLEAHRAHAN